MIDVQSQPNADALAVSPQGARIRRLILERCGLYFRDHERKGLETTVCGRMAAVGVSDFAAYLNLLQDSQEEFCALLNLLTIRHTYFFRNEPQFDVLQHRVLPELMAAKRQMAPPGGPTLTVWSAGCSTGEEPYSLAMAVTKAIPDISQWKVTIHATDVSTQALAAAQTGVYTAASMQLVSPTDRVAFFEETVTPQGKHRFRVKDSIRRLVQFRYLNLQEDDYPEHVDLIFCRNVMIYFDQKTVRNLVERFYSSLRPPGYFFIGYAETLQGVSNDFKLTLDREGVYYRKLAPSALHQEVTVPPVAATVIAEPVTSPVLSLAAASPIEAITKAVLDKDYPRALRLIKQVDTQAPHAVEAFYHAAFIQTNQGNFKEAVQLDTLRVVFPK